jgi:hypothetical protein
VFVLGPPGVFYQLVHLRRRGACLNECTLEARWPEKPWRLKLVRFGIVEKLLLVAEYLNWSGWHSSF